MKKELEELSEFVREMRDTSKSTAKVAIIARSSAFIHKVLEATYNPFKQYYVTSKTCNKNNKLKKKFEGDLWDLLDSLNKRKVTGHSAIEIVNGFVYNHLDDGVLIYDILDKDLKIRVGAKIINKAVPGLIPTFSVTLAKEYDGKCDWNDGWYASRKLDGVRCLAVVNEDGICTLYSRMGKELTTLNKVKESIEDTGIINTVFDGEICLVDSDGNENFQGIMKQLRRKDHQIENPAYMIFDMLHKPHFDAQECSEKLSDRLRTLRAFLEGKFINKDILRYTEQFQITDNDHFNFWAEKPKQEGWEGIMLRKDVGYEGKRTKNLLKVKMFFDAEYEVIDYDVDEMEVVRYGRQDTISMLAQVWIEHKGHKVKVGSGFTQEQRLQYTDGSIVGKLITVQYFEETKNDKGGISLRFPTVKHIYNRERDM